MTISLADWDEDIVYEPEEEYQAMFRAIQRTQGFGLIFLECASRQAKQVIDRVQKDITQKSVDVLAFQEPLKDGNVYKQVKQKLAQDPVDVLFIQGLELSLYDYEDTKRHLGWSSEDIYAYSWKGVPPIMVNLNQQREDFRDSFNTCLIFVLPLFAIKYFIHRAPDFFDWRSGHFHFPMDVENLRSSNLDCLVRSSTTEVAEEEKSEEHSIRDIIAIQALLDEPKQSPEDREKLLIQQASLLIDCGEYEGAIAGCKKVLRTNSQNSECLHQMGVALYKCDRAEEAFKSFDAALLIEPKREKTWIQKGLCLHVLNRNSEAIETYEKAIEINGNNPFSLYCKGISLFRLCQYQESISNYNKALKITDKLSFIWAGKAHSCIMMGLYKSAIMALDKAVKINPDTFNYWFVHAQTLAIMGNSRAAIKSYSKVIELEPKFSTAWHQRGLAKSGIGKYEEAVLDFRKALEIHPDNPTSWMCLGGTLRSLKRYEEAINCYEKSLDLGKTPEWWCWSGQIIPLLRLGYYQKAILSIYKTLITFRLDYGTKEWVERRISIFLFHSPFNFLVQLWVLFLRKIRFR